MLANESWVRVPMISRFVACWLNKCISVNNDVNFTVIAPKESPQNVDIESVMGPGNRPDPGDEKSGSLEV